MFIKPAPGVQVRDPFTKRHLPAEGKEVQESSYWARRLRSGDVVLVTPPAAPAPQPKSKTAPKDKEQTP